MSTGARIILTDEGDWWVAKDGETGVTSQGRTKEAALENLDEALDGFDGDGEAPTDEQLRKAGIDPERNVMGDLDDSDIFE